MAKLIGAILVVMVAIAVIVKFKTFFIIAGILAAAAFIAVKAIKKRKADAAPKKIAAEEPAKPDTITNAYEVKGVVFYLNNLLSLHEPNYLYDYKKQDLIDTCNYDVPIYKTVVKASRIDLTHEPDNPHDPNAIMVLLDDKLVGYMPKESCKHILELMDNGRFVSASFNAYGGKYKRVDEDYDSMKDKSTYTMETGEDEYGITVYIKEKIEN